MMFFPKGVLIFIITQLCACDAALHCIGTGENEGARETRGKRQEIEIKKLNYAANAGMWHLDCENVSTMKLDDTQFGIKGCDKKIKCKVIKVSLRGYDDKFSTFCEGMDDEIFTKDKLYRP